MATIYVPISWIFLMFFWKKANPHKLTTMLLMVWHLLNSHYWIDRSPHTPSPTKGPGLRRWRLQFNVLTFPPHRDVFKHLLPPTPFPLPHSPLPGRGSALVFVGPFASLLCVWRARKEVTICRQEGRKRKKRVCGGGASGVSNLFTLS